MAIVRQRKLAIKVIQKPELLIPVGRQNVFCTDCYIKNKVKTIKRQHYLPGMY